VRRIRTLSVRPRQHVVLDLRGVGAIDADGLDAVATAATTLQLRGASVEVTPGWAAAAVALTGWSPST
jgi:hypothetical protein